jgi:hypothetical protein
MAAHHRRLLSSRNSLVANRTTTPVMILHTVYGVVLGGFLGAGILG